MSLISAAGLASAEKISVLVPGSTVVQLAADLEAPVLKGQVIGEVVLKLGDEEMASYPICAAAEVGRVNLGVALRWLLAALFG